MFLSDPPYRISSCASFLMVALWIAAISLVADGGKVKPPFYAYYSKPPTSKDEWVDNVRECVQTFEVSNDAELELIELEGKTEEEKQKREGDLKLAIVEAFKEFIDKGICYKFKDGGNIVFFPPLMKIPEHGLYRFFKYFMPANYKERIRSKHQEHTYSAHIRSEYGDTAGDMEKIECDDFFPTVFKQVFASISVSDIHEKGSKSYLSVAAQIQKQYSGVPERSKEWPEGLPEVVSLVELRMFLGDRKCLEDVYSCM